jgi:hypothetical protein
LTVIAFVVYSEAIFLCHGVCESEIVTLLGLVWSEMRSNRRAQKLRLNFGWDDRNRDMGRIGGISKRR